MALTYGFYNSIEGDRVYDAIQFGRIFDGIIKDGIYATYEKGMMVIASSNPGEVIIQPGRAWFNHTWSYNDANVIFEAPAPEVLLERYDALVLEINEELSARENSFKWVTGTPSSRPERPTLTNTSTIHQYPLCYVHRYPETTMIYTRDITNAIGTSECPFATGVLEGIDLDAWINQWDDEFHNWESTTKTGFETWMLNQEQVYTTWFDNMHSQMDTDLAEFEAWFETIQGIIDEEAALHLQQEIDELRQEATSGSRIFVHTQEQTLIGKNVTITEAGGTVFTSRFDNTGVAEFKSIPYVGNLTISSTDGIETATSVVNTPYYARYNFTIAFWAATVNIVSDPEMSGSTVTVRDSDEILVGTVVLDSEGTGVYTAIKPDTYKFTLTYGGETMEVTLSVTQETTYTVDLHAAGFKWEDWLEAGGVTGSYSSLDDVLEDKKALRRLFTVHASVDYMAGIDKENEDVEKIIGTDLAAKWINLRDYALDTLYANTIIADYMDEADKYFYGEWALMPQVPTMTANDAPYGTVSTSSIAASSYAAWKAFDNDNTTRWSSADNVGEGEYLIYQSPTPVIVKKFKLHPFWNGTALFVKGYKIQGSNDGTTWVDLFEESFDVNEDVGIVIHNISNDTAYTYLKFLATSDSYFNQKDISIIELQFYAWQPKGNVPAMTANNVPYGVAIGTQNYSSGYQLWYAFDDSQNAYASVSTQSAYIGYKFVNPISVKMAKLYSMVSIEDPDEKAQLIYSDDGTNWHDVGTQVDVVHRNGVSDVAHATKLVNSSLNEYHLYWAVRITSDSNSTHNLVSLQFYGRELSVSVPVMTSNTAPYGTAIIKKPQQDGNTYEPWKVFDGKGFVGSTTYWVSLQDGGMVIYDFKKQVVPRMFMIRGTIDASTYPWSIGNAELVGSNDNDTYVTLGHNDVALDKNDGEQYFFADNLTNDSYRYIGIKRVANIGGAGFAEAQFYCEDYSEKEFEEGTTKKWLYDHGVELETMYIDSAVGEKKDSFLRYSKPDSQTYATAMCTTNSPIDISPFSILRAKSGSWGWNSAANGQITLGITSARGNTPLTAYRDNTPTDAPNNFYLDVSSVNETKYVGFGWGNKAAVNFDIKELWLE